MGSQLLTARGALLEEPLTNVFARQQTAREGHGAHLPLSLPPPACHLPTAMLEVINTTLALAFSV